MKILILGLKPNQFKEADLCQVIVQKIQKTATHQQIHLIQQMSIQIHTQTARTVQKIHLRILQRMPTTLAILQMNIVTRTKNILV